MKFSMMSYTMARGDWGKNPDIRKLCQFTSELDLEGIDFVTAYGIDPKEVHGVDHKSVLRAMKNAGYSGYINLEYDGNKYNPREAMIKGLKTLQDMKEEI